MNRYKENLLKHWKLEANQFPIEELLISKIPVDIASNREFLHPAEIALASSFKSNKRRLEFLGGRYFLRKSLFSYAKEDLLLQEKILATPFLPDTDGKIAKIDSLPPFSLSHSGGYVAVVVGKSSSNTSCGIGIDLQEIKPIKGSLEKKIVCCLEELDYLSSQEENNNEMLLKLVSHRDLKLLTLFSAKEALFKSLPNLSGTIFTPKKFRLEYSSRQRFLGVVTSGVGEKDNKLCSSYNSAQVIYTFIRPDEDNSSSLFVLSFSYHAAE